MGGSARALGEVAAAVAELPGSVARMLGDGADPHEVGRVVATVTDRVSPGVVYTTFHHPDTQANVITTDHSDWATNCPEYKVTAVQVSPSNGPTEWQVEYDRQAEQSRRIKPRVDAAE